MFERINSRFFRKGNRVKSVTVKVKINSSMGPWRVADMQFQEGSVATGYTEHVSEMERVKGK